MQNMTSKKQQVEMTKQEKRYILSNKHKHLIYEGDYYWWYDDGDKTRDLWLEDEEIDYDKLKCFINTIREEFEMDNSETILLIELMFKVDLDDYIDNENRYSKEFRDFLKKHNFEYTSYRFSVMYKAKTIINMDKTKGTKLHGAFLYTFISCFS